MKLSSLSHKLIETIYANSKQPKQQLKEQLRHFAKCA